MKPVLKIFLAFQLPLFLLLSMISLGYPLMFLLPKGFNPYASRFELFSLASASLFSIVLITARMDLIKRLGNRSVCIFIFLPILLPASVLALHALRIEDGLLSLLSILEGLSYFSIPLAFILYSRHKRTRAWLFSFIAFLAIFNILHCVWQFREAALSAEGIKGIIGIFISPPMGPGIIGFCGNRNWNAALILACSPFLLFHLKTRIQNKLLARNMTWVTAGVLSVFFYFCASRASFLAAGTVLAFFALLQWEKYRRLAIIGLCGLCAFALTLVLFRGLGTEKLYEETRIPLWQAGVKVLATHPFIGVGTRTYESAFSEARPVSYFLRDKYFAHRSNHPHNEFLHIAGIMGLPAAACWLLFWGYPLAFFARNFRLLTVMRKILFFGASTLFIHGMLDMVLVQWPTGMLSMLFLGLLWAETISMTRHEKNEGPAPMPVKDARKLVYTAPKYLLATFLFCVLIWVVKREALFSLYHRAAWIYGSDNPIQALRCVDKALENKQGYECAYYGGLISKNKLGDHYLALEFFLHSRPECAYGFSRNNRHIAESLYAVGMKKESLEYWKKELSLYPVSIYALFHITRIQSELGMKEKAVETAARLAKVMELKNLDLENIPEILRTPHLDDKFSEISHAP